MNNNEFLEKLNEIIGETLTEVPAELKKDIVSGMMSGFENGRMPSSQDVIDHYVEVMVENGMFDVVTETISEKNIRQVKQLNAAEAAVILDRIERLFKANRYITELKLQVAEHNNKVKDQQARTTSQLIKVRDIKSLIAAKELVLNQYEVSLDIEEGRFFKNKKAISRLQDEIEALESAIKQLNKTKRKEIALYEKYKAAEEKIKTLPEAKIKEYLDNATKVKRLNKPK